MASLTIDRRIPRWATPLQPPARYKGASGGRASGKSHLFAEELVERSVCDPSLRAVCIREVQRSLKFSAKSLIESKIKDLGVSSEYDVLSTEIRRRGGDGVIIFEGMQDHTADSLKSLEAFGVAWVEEAQRLSERSLRILLPTIRMPGSEVWFSWNPDQDDDPVDTFFRDDPPDNSVHVHSTYLDNPFCPQEAKDEAERMRRVDPEGYAHVWLGEYNTRSDAQVLSGKWRVDEFESAAGWDGPYYGADWGFSADPTMLVRFWLGDARLWIEYETGGVQWDYDEIARRWSEIPGASEHVIRADSARPESINEMSQRGYKVEAAPKPKGSVEDGVAWLRSHEEIVIHERCKRMHEEARLWSYKTDRLTGDPLPRLKPGNDHGWDAVRYGAAPMILTTDEQPGIWVSKPLSRRARSR